MKNFNKVLAAMSTREEDKKIAGYLDFLSPLLGIREVCNFHVFASEYLYEELNEYSPGKGIEFIKTIEKNMAEQMDGIYRHISKKTNEVAVGRPLHELKNKTETWGADLIALGKPEKGHSTLAKKVVRHIGTNVLVVPDGADIKLGHILVPVDLSEHSGKVLRTALDLQEKAGDEVKITCLNIFDVPMLPIYNTFASEARFGEYVRAQNQKAFDKFIDQYAGEDKHRLECVLLEEVIDRPSQYILEYINENDVDFVVMGTHSHSAFDAFLGSNVERVLTENNKTPLLLVK
ncbi:MAG TPA: universal stress protein [Bacteroidetes bacterium]|nr:universal stress protein [Bacteroidota bacterium]